MYTLEKIISYAIKNGASDIHLTVGSPPAVRIDGVIRFVGDVALKPEHTMGFLDEIMPKAKKDRFLETGDCDQALSLPGMGRFRVNCLIQRGSVGIIMRHVRAKIMDVEALNLPLSLNNLAQAPRGLVLVTGTTGSGKSTTLAALIDKINETRRLHILTLEDPIEFLYTNKKSIITQREISIDTHDFHTALRAAMREDPDVILIGEMRDAETFQAAIMAAETGHLVFTTLHTSNAMMTIDRMLDFFPASQQDQVRSQLSLQLRACIAQRLLPAANGKGRVPAVEVLFNSPAIAALIRDNNPKQIPLAIIQGRQDGMQTFNMSLAILIRKKLVTEDEAMFWSDNPEELRMNLQGIYLSQSRAGILKR